MDSLTALVSALGLSYAAGVSLYATVAVTGAAARLGWIGPLPAHLQVLADPWVLGLATALALVEALALLVPWVATAWETVHTAVKPLCAAALAVLATWGSPRLAVVAGLLGGALGLATHTTKLGLRAALDLSPEPLSNGAATAGELGVVAALAFAVWSHPFLALGGALLLLCALYLLVRALWRLAARSITTFFTPGTER
jgi:hypothetical protein